MKRFLLLAGILAASCACGGEDEGECPGGTLIGVVGVEAWCAVSNDHGGWTRHGIYEKWDHDIGYLETRGHYCHGFRCGVWTKWYESGSKKSERSLTERGVPCGPDIRWDEEGNESIFEEYPPC